MATTHKKVIVRKMDRDTVNGYVRRAFISDGKLEVLNTAGNVVAIDLSDVKGVYFVREFGDSESLTRKTFTSRPRTEGLWVRLRFRDNEIIEGMMPNDLLQDGDRGLLHHPAGHPLEYAAHLRAALGAGGDDRARRDRREEVAASRPHPEDTRQVPMFNDRSCIAVRRCSHRVSANVMKLAEIASALGATLENGDPATEITGVAGIEEAAAGHITFVANPKYAAVAKTTTASAVIVSEDFPAVATGDAAQQESLSGLRAGHRPVLPSSAVCARHASHRGHCSHCQALARTRTSAPMW